MYMFSCQTIFNETGYAVLPSDEWDEYEVPLSNHRFDDCIRWYLSTELFDVLGGANLGYELAGPRG